MIPKKKIKIVREFIDYRVNKTMKDTRLKLNYLNLLANRQVIGVKTLTNIGTITNRAAVGYLT